MIATFVSRSRKVGRPRPAATRGPSGTSRQPGRFGAQAHDAAPRVERAGRGDPDADRLGQAVRGAPRARTAAATSTDPVQDGLDALLVGGRLGAAAMDDAIGS